MTLTTINIYLVHSLLNLKSHMNFVDLSKKLIKYYNLKKYLVIYVYGTFVRSYQQPSDHLSNQV